MGVCARVAVGWLKDEIRRVRIKLIVSKHETYRRDAKEGGGGGVSEGSREKTHRQDTKYLKGHLVTLPKEC